MRAGGKQSGPLRQGFSLDVNQEDFLLAGKTHGLTSYGSVEKTRCLVGILPP